MSKRIEVRGRPVGGGKLPLVCTPLVGANRDALLAEAREVASKRPDVVEWRVDFFEPIGRTGEVIDAGRELKAIFGDVPLLFTRRSTKEGGRPIPIDEPRLLELYDAICASGCIDLIDYELSNEPADVQHVRAQAHRNGVGLVLSFHDFDETPSADALVEKFMAMQGAGADVAKVAVMPKSREDVLTLLSATHQADQSLHIPLISMSMGPLGVLSRICGWMFGSALTFAVGMGSSAPGQIPLDELRGAVDILRKAVGASAD
jgi:3-dehydroquinate dehydratase-1